MKRYLFIGCVVIGSTSYAQTASPEVIATAGEHYENASMQMSWTLGETVITTETDGSTATVNQGFHQTNVEIVGIEELIENFSITAYPNPSIDVLNIELSKSIEDGNYRIADLQGKVVREESFNGSTHTIDVTNFAPGQYQLTILNKGSLVGNITIQKHH